MPQSSIILFFLIAGFVVYTTTKGELPVYLGILTGATSQSEASGSGWAVPSASAPTSGNADQSSSYNWIIPGL